MATVTASVKESLLGATQPEELTQSAKADFMKHAKHDEDGELYMGEEEFVAAIAPPEEDYVSTVTGPSQLSRRKCDMC